jgi:hypothetical protein
MHDWYQHKTGGFADAREKSISGIMDSEKENHYLSLLTEGKLKF